MEIQPPIGLYSGPLFWAPPMPPVYSRLSLNDFARHLNGSKRALTGRPAGLGGLFTPHRLATLVLDVLEALRYPSTLWNDLAESLEGATAVQAHTEDLQDPSLAQVVGHHQLPYGFTFFGANLVQGRDQESLAVLYSTIQGDWRARVFPHQGGPDAAEGLMRAIEEAFPDPTPVASPADALPPQHEPAAEPSTASADRRFIPMSEEAFAAYLVEHLIKPSSEGEWTSRDDEDVEYNFDNRVEHALHIHRLPVEAFEGPYVSFDTENIVPGGVVTIAGDLVMWRGEAGGDWEWPVHFYIYVNGDGELRTYVPLRGNACNEHGEAYDNEAFVGGQLPLELQADTIDMEAEIREFFGLVPCQVDMATASSSPAQNSPSTNDGGTEPVDVEAVAQRLRDILQRAATQSPAIATDPTPVAPHPSAAPAKGKLSTEDCKAFLEQHPAVTAMGLTGPWKRASKKGNAQMGVVRVFEGKKGWAKLLEKDGQLSLLTLSAEDIV